MKTNFNLPFNLCEGIKEIKLKPKTEVKLEQNK
jgi:hypothetical protein